MESSFHSLLIFMVVTSGVHSNHVDTTRARMARTTPQNCSRAQLYLGERMVSHRPYYHSDPSDVQMVNRTSLQYAFNTALGRATFYSFIYSWTNTSREFEEQPGLNYMYMSEAANVLAGPEAVTSSGLFFLPHRAYPNWIQAISFNSTFPLFAVRASREQGDNLVSIKDLGNTPGTNYTNRSEYRQGEFFRDAGDYDGGQYELFVIQRLTNSVGPSYETMFFKSIWYPAANLLPARMYQPYYDCGQTNQWLVPLVSKVAELLPRYSLWTHLRHIMPEALSTVDVQFSDIDINQCNASLGNEGTNVFAGTAPCFSQYCKVLSGHGLADGGYQCCSQWGCSNEYRTTPAELARGQQAMAAPDWRLCFSPNPPHHELSNEFWDLNDLKATFEVQGRAGLRLAHFLSNFLQNNHPEDNARNQEYIEQAWRDHFNTLKAMRRQGLQVNFTSYPQWDTPMRFVKVDHAITRKWLEAEVLSTVMADGQIMSAGIFLEPGVFPDSTNPVSAFAWKPSVTPETYSAPLENHLYGYIADRFLLGEDFSQEDFYTQARQTYSGTNTSSRTTFHTTSTVRTGYSDQPPVQNVPGQVTYVSVDYEAGTWLPPFYYCNRRFRHWSVSYMVPIFVNSATGNGVDFGGVVKVDSYFTTNHLYTRHR